MIIFDRSLEVVLTKEEIIMAKYCRIVTIVDLIRTYRDAEAEHLLKDAWSYLNRGNKDATEYSWRTYETSFGSNTDPLEKITTHSITKPSLHDIKTCNGTDVRIAYNNCGCIIGVWLCLWENNRFISVSFGELNSNGNEIHSVFNDDGSLAAGYSYNFTLSPGINEIAQ